MSRYQFTATPAHRGNIKLRLGLCGIAGSGKSFTALAIATALSKRLGCGHVYMIDSENGSGLRYAPSASGKGFDFYHVPLFSDDYSPDAYEAAIRFCEQNGAGVIVIDSISHEWDGPKGILDIVDANNSPKDNMAGWRIATPLHRRFLQTLNSVSVHAIWTVRAKADKAFVDDPNRPGKKKYEAIGVAPVGREGIEYEGDVFAWIHEATLTVDKTRCDYLPPGSIWPKAGDDFAEQIAAWVRDVPAMSAEDARLAAAISAAVNKARVVYQDEGEGAAKKALWAMLNVIRGIDATAVYKVEWAKLKSEAERAEAAAVNEMRAPGSDG